MSEKSDDIKQLFSHLGLNPGDYQEIRNAPSAGATMTEAPRRWSLLQAISAPSAVASVAPAARVMPSLAPATAPAVVPAAPPPPTPSQWAEILPGLATAPSTPAPTPTPEPPLTAAGDGLKSLFQSVREPVPAAPAAPAPSSQPVSSSLTGEQAADLLYRELRGGAQTLAARPPPPPVTPPWAGYDPEQETRHAPTPATPVRVAPPHSPPPPASAPAAAAAAPTRLVLPLATEPMPEMPRPVAPPRPVLAPVPAPTPTPAVAAAPRSPLPAAPSLRAEAAPAATGLQAAFRRLSEPEPPRAAASGRLRLNYRLPHSSGAGGSKDERLGDVLKRISGHNGESR